MARWMVTGTFAEVEITQDDINSETWQAECVGHNWLERRDGVLYPAVSIPDEGCTWSCTDYDLNDMMERADQHADTGRQDA